MAEFKEKQEEAVKYKELKGLKWWQDTAKNIIWPGGILVELLCEVKMKTQDQHPRPAQESEVLP